jgi:hypothetical protein
LGNENESTMHFPFFYHHDASLILHCLLFPKHLAKMADYKTNPDHGASFTGYKSTKGTWIQNLINFINYNVPSFNELFDKVSMLI